MHARLQMEVTEVMGSNRSVHLCIDYKPGQFLCNLTCTALFCVSSPIWYTVYIYYIFNLDVVSLCRGSASLSTWARPAARSATPAGSSTASSTVSLVLQCYNNSHRFFLIFVVIFQLFQFKSFFYVKIFCYNYYIGTFWMLSV